MTKYFADAWYFIARIARGDAHHAAARRLAARLPTATLLTHDAVLFEVLAYFSDEGPATRGAAAAVVRDLLATAEVVQSSRALFLRALTRYEQRPDKEYSLVDCMSMVVMEERGIRHVLTNDHHFAQAGFVVVSQ